MVRKNVQFLKKTNSNKKKATSYNMGLKIPLRSIANSFGKGGRPKPHELLKSQGRYMK